MMISVGDGLKSLFGNFKCHNSTGWLQIVLVYAQVQSTPLNGIHLESQNVSTLCSHQRLRYFPPDSTVQCYT